MKKKEHKKTDKKEEEYRKKVVELTDSLQRLQAEFENFKKSCEKASAEFRKYSESRLIAELLPIIDTFDIALKNNSREDEFSKGIVLLNKQIHDLLKQKGLKPIESVGRKFDPYYHEVMLSVEDDGDEGVVLEELQKGYMLHDRVLRHSKVKVSKKGDSPKDKTRSGG